MERIFKIKIIWVFSHCKALGFRLYLNWPHTLPWEQSSEPLGYHMDIVVESGQPWTNPVPNKSLGSSSGNWNQPWAACSLAFKADLKNVSSNEGTSNPSPKSRLKLP
jgi:hypothetical protein